MKSYYLKATLFYGIIVSTSFAEDAPLLQKAIRLGLDSPQSGSYSLLKLESMQRYQDAKKKESLSYFFPSLTLTGNHLFDQKYLFTDILFSGATTKSSVPQIIPDTQLSLTAQWWIIDGFANFNRLRSANYLSESIENEKNWARFKLERELKLAYYQMSTDKALIQVAEENRNALKRHRDDAEKLFSVGSGTKYDKLRMESELSQAEVNLLSAEDRFESSRSRFRELIGKNGEELNNLSRTEVSSELPSLDEVRIQKLLGSIAEWNRQEESRLDLKALTLKSEALQQQVYAANTHFSPKIGLFAQKTFYNNLSSSFNTNDFRNAYQYGVNLSWNLFDGFYSTSRVSQVREEKVQSEIELERLKLQKSEEEKVWMKKLETSTKFISAREIEVEKAEEASKMATTGRRAGTLTGAQLLDAEVERFRAKAGLLTAKLSQIEALLKLELITGKNLIQKE